MRNGKSSLKKCYRLNYWGKFLVHEEIILYLSQIKDLDGEKGGGVRIYIVVETPCCTDIMF